MVRSRSSSCALAAVFVLAASCGTFGADAEDAPAPPAGDASSTPNDAAPPTDDGGSDAEASMSADAGPCDTTRPWGTPVALANVNGLPGASLGIPSPDELSLFITATNGLRTGVFAAFRTKRGEDFALPSLLPGGLNGSLSYSSLHPSVTAAGTELYYEREDVSSSTLYVSKRATLADTFPAGTSVPGISGSPKSPSITPNGLSLYFSDQLLAGNYSDLYVMTRASTSSNFSAPTRLDILSSVERETHPVPSADELTIYFARVPSAGGTKAMWVARRADTMASFGPPQKVEELSVEDENLPTGLSADGCSIYLTTKTGAGNAVIKVARRPGTK